MVKRLALSLDIFAEMSSLKKELIWLGGLLIAFLGFLMIFGSPSYSELAIATAAFTINWLIVSYCVKRLGVGSIETKSLNRELMWFGGLLIAFLGFLMIVGPPKHSELAIATAAFTFIWLIRSYLVKKFAVPKN